MSEPILRRRVLAIYAHPDDAEIWAGGTLLAHRAAGDEIAMCVLTHGDTPRAAEARLGADRLGATLYQFDFPDRALAAHPEALTAVDGVLREVRPALILTHWGGDSHPDHLATWRTVHHSVLNAKIEDTLQGVYWSDTYNSLGITGIFEPDVVIDVSDQWDTKLAAIQAHQSQHPERYVAMTTRQCELHGERSGVRYAEGFQRVYLFGRGRRAVSTLWERL